MHGLYTLLIVILLLSSIVLIILVLMQSGKGSGLSGAFGSAGGGESSVFGANTANVVMKATAVFAAIFMLSCIAVAVLQQHIYRPALLKGFDEEAIESYEPGETGTLPKEKNDKEKDANQLKGTDDKTGGTDAGAAKNSEIGTVEEAKEEAPSGKSDSVDEKKEPAETESGKQ